MLYRVVWKILINVSEELTASVTVMMEAVNSPEKSVNMYQTIRCNIPDDAVFILNSSSEIVSVNFILLIFSVQ
jgi:hypothetical protein